jgi:uncharacterized protein (TIGR03083 family)
VALDRDWLIGIARHERVALGTTVQYTPPDRWEAESPCEGWRVKDVLAHLAGAEVAAAALVGEEEATELEEFRKTLDTGPLTLNGWNAWAVEKRRDAPTRSLALEWGRAADLLLARTSETAPEEWLKRVVAWFDYDLPLGYLIQLRVCEWWVHGEDIRAGGGLPPRREHPPIFCVNDFAIRSLPYWLSLAEQTFPGSVQVTLEGVGEGTWHRGLAPGDRPSEKKKPDVVIDGYGYYFALVAAGRMDPDVALYEGVINAGGNAAAIDAIFKNLRVSG